MPNHERGYTQKGKGVFSTDEQMNLLYERKSQFDAIYFTESRQRIVVDAALEVCNTIGISAYYLVCVSTHLHALVGWKDEREWEMIYDRIKRIIALKLARSEGVAGRRWLAARRNGTAICSREHFVHLVHTYLPDHQGVRYVDEQALGRINNGRL